ncbi:MAG: hypothetical protein JRI75_06960 [Deltaproteobacteria bacterium]|nr:hypothetical protein [Deltaproteobacteria bacterium]
MTDIDAEETLNQFVVEFYLQTQGDPSNIVSWYDIGETLGLDREGSSQAAEELIGTGLAEIKTLNGGIGITDDGIAEAEQLGAALGAVGGAGPILGDAPILDETGSLTVGQIAGSLKNQMGEKNWDFNTLSELMADLKSIDAQLSSPNPKTAVIRECFLSIMGVLQKGNDADSLTQVRTLLGE